MTTNVTFVEENASEMTTETKNLPYKLISLSDTEGGVIISVNEPKYEHISVELVNFNINDEGTMSFEYNILDDVEFNDEEFQEFEQAVIKVVEYILEESVKSYLETEESEETN